MMIVDNKFEHGQIVYLVTDPEQAEYIVTAIHLNGSPNNILYELFIEKETTLCYEFEISVEKSFKKV